MILLYILLSFLVVVAIIPAFMRVSEQRGVMDFSDGDSLKIHANPKSFFGGLSIFIAILISLFLFNFPESKGALFIIACLIIFLLGLWDDFNWKHISKRKPYLKFLFLILCSFASAFILYFAGISFFVFPFVIAPIYVFVLINAINYQDGMDGQAATMFLISVIGFCALSLVSGNDFISLICLISFGAVLGFMVYNFPPAKIFMGDSGAYMLGFILAALSIFFSKNVLSHLFIIGLPLFDGIYTNIRRMISGKSIFLGDRDHFYDKILRKGFSARQILLISASLQIIFVIIGVLIYYNV